MTTYTDHGLVCLDSQDYGAIALAMQTDALATEASLDAISDAFDTHYSKPYMLGITTANWGPVSASGEAEQAVPNWSVDVTNMTTTGATGGIQVTIPISGWYSHGGYLNMVAAGAVTPLSRRTAFAKAFLQESGHTTLLSQAIWRTIDTATTGEILVASGGLFYATAGQTVDIDLYFSHNNAASSINIPPPARIWCHYAGGGIEIGSA